MGFQDEVFALRPANRGDMVLNFPRSSCCLLVGVPCWAAQKIGDFSGHHLPDSAWIYSTAPFEVVDLLWFEVPDLSVQFVFRQNGCKWCVALPCCPVFVRREYVCDVSFSVIFEKITIRNVNENNLDELLRNQIISQTHISHKHEVWSYYPPHTHTHTTF